MTALAPDDFAAFFEAVHGYAPFPWQHMLAERVAAQGWPEGIDLPTASGKTACLDVAVFALALSAQRGRPGEPPAPRRIFFVVDRRIVVDEANRRARDVAKALRHAETGIVKHVADALRELAGGDEPREPLVVSRLRGGTLQDDAWRLNPAQAAVVTSTVDQAGSRLLFRSYGSGLRSAPIEAGLLACDALLLLDEAHCAVSFLQTARAVRRYAGPQWSAAGESLAPPLTVSVLSATLPPDVRDVFPGPEARATALDSEELLQRTCAPKPAELAVARKPGKRDGSLGEPVCDDLLVLHAAQRAADWAADGEHLRIAVMVNRVATAGEICRQLQQAVDAGTLDADVVLLTGRMRPIDRDQLVNQWSRFLKAREPEKPERPVILATTQCLEVGADFSFDALVTECASLDALRQRFGRLNRLGTFDNAAAAVLVRREQTADAPALDRIAQKQAGGGKPSASDKKRLDPIYGLSLARTWNWLHAHAEGGRFDFGIEAVRKELPQDRHELALLLAPAPDAPVLLPAHVDLLCQTAPRPEPDLDVSLFLHGPQRGAPEAHIVFRADLQEGRERDWPDAVTVLPPVTAEALTVPLWLLRRLLTEQPADEALAELGDVEGQQAREEEQLARGRAFVLWRGRRDTELSRDPRHIRPGATVVLPADERLAVALGHAFTRPADTLLDRAEPAYRSARNRHVLRLVPSVLKPWQAAAPVANLLDWARDEERDAEGLPALLNALAAYQPDEQAGEAVLPPWLPDRADALAGVRLRAESHPGGLVLLGPPKLENAALDLGTGDDDDALSAASEDVSLSEHTNDVASQASDWARRCLPDEAVEAAAAAARLHDAGKADPRFQVLLHGDEVEAAVALADGRVLAKSTGPQRATSRQRRLRRVAELPAGFRHEMLSAQMAEARGAAGDTDLLRDLVLHLIASHHGHGRPFAPVVKDDEQPDVQADLGDATYALSEEQRHALPPPHRLDSGVAERFWRLTRHYGWWQLAYLEALLRLADRRASAAEASRPRPAGQGRTA